METSSPAPISGADNKVQRAHSQLMVATLKTIQVTNNQENCPFNILIINKFTELNSKLRPTLRNEATDVWESNGRFKCTKQHWPSKLNQKVTSHWLRQVINRSIQDYKRPLIEWGQQKGDAAWLRGPRRPSTSQSERVTRNTKYLLEKEQPPTNQPTNQSPDRNGRQERH